jgi:hypothetical protein
MRFQGHKTKSAKNGGGLAFIILLAMAGLVAAIAVLQPKPVTASRVYVTETTPLPKGIRQDRDYLASGGK